MAGRLSRSWSLASASWQVLKQDTQLMVFPFVSAIASIVVAAAFALGAFGFVGFDGLSRLDRHAANGVFYVGAFAFYVSLYFVTFFCNAALVGAAMIRFGGGTPTVGMILRAIQERIGFLGRIVVGLLGVGWTVATAMVVPVLVTHDVGPVDAVKESAGLLKKTWGENVIGKGGLSLAFLVVYLALIVAAIALVVGAIWLGSTALLVMVCMAAVVAFILTALAHSALTGIYSAALYRYATTGSAGAGFDSGVLQAAFAPK